MNYVIETGGKQYLVKTGDKLRVEKLATDNSKPLEIKTLLAFEGENIQIGKPYLAENAKINVIRQGREDKVRVFKYRAKSKYRRTIGHRQYFTEIEVQ